VIIAALLLLALFGVSGAAILVFTHGAAAPLLYALGALIVSNLGFALPLAIASLTIAGLSLMALAAEIHEPGSARDFIIDLFTLGLPRDLAAKAVEKAHRYLKPLAYAAGFVGGILLYPIIPVIGFLSNTYNTASKVIMKLLPFWLGIEKDSVTNTLMFTQNWKGKLGKVTGLASLFLIAWPLSMILFPLTTVVKGASEFGRWIHEGATNRKEKTVAVAAEPADEKSSSCSKLSCLGGKQVAGYTNVADKDKDNANSTLITASDKKPKEEGYWNSCWGRTKARFSRGKAMVTGKPGYDSV
jgi:hypothetical protein